MTRPYLVGLIGVGIRTSLTPAIHEAEAAHLGLAYEYRTLDLDDLGKRPDDLDEILTWAAAEGFDAVNVTHPCKQTAFDLVDHLDDDARRLGAVNLVLLRDGRRTGGNTDWIGYRDAVRDGLPGASLSRIVQVGCGGAGAATAYALLSLGAAELQLADTSDERAALLAANLGGLFPAARVTALASGSVDQALSAARGVVHATPTGMAQHPGVAFDVTLLPAGTWVSDVVYRPLETELVRRATERGLPVLDGGRMAVGQAFTSLEIITGRRPDRARMLRHFQSLVGEERRAMNAAE